MSCLQKLQYDFGRSVFYGHDQDIDQSIRAGELKAEQRLNIYRNNIFHGLSEALGDVYPVIKRLVGDEFFRYLAEHYCKRYPSRSGNLHDFGNGLSDFLNTFEPAQSLVYLPDLAKLEWAIHRAFHAADILPININTMAWNALMNADKLTFNLNPACQLIASDYPILEIWQVNQHACDCDKVISLNEGGVNLLVNRIDYEIMFQTLTPGEYLLLEALADAASLGEACEIAFAVAPDLDLPHTLFGFVKQQILVDYRIN